MAFYYPQDTTEEMGPTAIVPGSHYYNTQPVPRVGSEIPLCGEAGTVILVDFNIWHRATPNRSDRKRLMMKFLFTRLEEPGRPCWNNARSDWEPDGENSQRAMWKHLWDWHRGGQNGTPRSGNLLDSPPIGELIEALGDESEWVGFQAAYELATLGAPAVPALLAAMRDTADAGRWHTMHERVNDGSFTRSTTANASYALSAIGAPAVPALIAAAGAPDEWLRASAVETLGDIGPAARDALPVLSQTAEDASVYVRRHAAEALGTAGQGLSTAAPPLMRALRDEDTRVRRGATIALARIGPHAEEAVPLLTHALEDEDRYVRGNTAHALSRIRTPSAIEALFDFLATARWCPLTTRESPY